MRKNFHKDMSILSIKTRMTTFTKRSSRNQTNIDKYRVAAHITEYQITSKLIFLTIIRIQLECRKRGNFVILTKKSVRPFLTC